MNISFKRSQNIISRKKRLHETNISRNIKSQEKNKNKSQNFSTTGNLQKQFLQFWGFQANISLFYDEICRENREESDKIWN